MTMLVFVSLCNIHFIDIFCSITIALFYMKKDHEWKEKRRDCTFNNKITLLLIICCCCFFHFFIDFNIMILIFLYVCVFHKHNNITYNNILYDFSFYSFFLCLFLFLALHNKQQQQKWWYFSCDCLVGVIGHKQTSVGSSSSNAASLIFAERCFTVSLKNWFIRFGKESKDKAGLLKWLQTINISRKKSLNS